MAKQELTTTDEQKMREAAWLLVELHNHIITRLNEGCGIVGIGCTVPQHLEPLYEEFLHLVGAEGDI